MHMEQLDAQDATLEDMDRKSRGAQAQADQALNSLKEVLPSLCLYSPDALCCNLVLDADSQAELLKPVCVKF